MSWQQRWFNSPPYPNCPFVTDRYGQKYWIGWDDNNFLYIHYRGILVGRVNLIFKDEGDVILADIVVFSAYRRGPNLRKRGLGKAMLKEAVRYAKMNGARFMHGWIQAERNENVTQEYLAEWYQRQGFEVNGTALYLDLQK